MNKRTVPVLILFLAASGLIMAKSAMAQTVSPAAEFMLKFVDNSYDVSPTYSTDQYTVRNVTIEADSYDGPLNEMATSIMLGIFTLSFDLGILYYFYFRKK